MELTGADLVRWISSFMWPFVRISSFFFISPIFGARSVTRRVRIVLAVTVAWLLMPSLPAIPDVAPFSATGMLITVQQVILGIGMGIVFQLAFATVVIAGQNIAMSMGLGFASAIDPQNGVQVPIVSQFYMIIATLLFLSLNGHLLLIETISKSFHLLPIGAPWPNELPWKIVLWGSQMFATALLIALPALGALLLVNLAFAVMTRAAPQLNIFAVGFPVTLTAGFLLILFTLPSYAPQVSNIFDSAFMQIAAILEH